MNFETRGSQRALRAAMPWLVLLVAFLATGGPSARCEADELDPDRVAWIRSRKPGDTVQIGAKADVNVLGAVGYLDHLRLVELLAASDEVGIRRMIEAKRCVKFEDRPAARVIKVGKDYVECRVNSGAEKDRAVYVHYSWVVER